MDLRLQMKLRKVLFLVQICMSMLWYVCSETHGESCYNLAREAIENNDVRRAMLYIEDAITKCSGNRCLVYKDFKRELHRKKAEFPQWIELNQGGTVMEDHNFVSNRLVQMKDMYSRLGEGKEINTLISVLLEETPYNVELFVLQSIQCIREGHHTDAFNALNKILQWIKEKNTIYTNMVLILLSIKDISETITFINSFISKVEDQKIFGILRKTLREVKKECANFKAEDSNKVDILEGHIDYLNDAINNLKIGTVKNIEEIVRPVSIDTCEYTDDLIDKTNAMMKHLESKNYNKMLMIDKEKIPVFLNLLTSEIVDGCKAKLFNKHISDAYEAQCLTYSRILSLTPEKRNRDKFDRMKTICKKCMFGARASNTLGKIYSILSGKENTLKNYIIHLKESHVRSLDPDFASKIEEIEKDMKEQEDKEKKKRQRRNGGHQEDEEDYYKILNIPRGSTKEDIRKAYKKMVKTHHPDKHRDPDEKKKAQEHFSKIGEAYAVLSDENKRKTYNMLGHRQYVNKERGGGTTEDFSGGSPFGNPFGNFYYASGGSSQVDFDSILKNMFGYGGSGGSSHSGSQGSRRRKKNAFFFDM